MEHLDGIEALNRAVKLAEDAVNVIPSNHPDLSDILTDLGSLLVRRSQMTGSLDDRERSIEVAEKTIKYTPLDHIDRTNRLEALGRWSYERFERFRAMKDIDRAVRMNRELVRSVPSEDSERASYLNNLGLALYGRFEETRSMEDLNESIKTAEDAVLSVPVEHPNRALYLSNFGNHIGTRYEQTGILDDLNRAVEISYESIKSTSSDYPNRAALLNNLGHWLAARFERQSSTEDLDGAVQIAEESVETTSTDDDPYAAAAHRHNLGNWLGRRFRRSGASEDINGAIENIEKSISALPSDFYPSRAAYLTNLGLWLGIRSRQNQSVEDLHRAIEVTRKAVEITPPDHADLALSLRRLSNWLGTRFKRSGSMEDLDDAIEVISETLLITPAEHFDKAGQLLCLGRWLHARAERTCSSEDCSFALDVFEEAWGCANADPALRIRAARHAAFILISQSNWDKSSILLQGAIELLPLLSPMTLQHEDKQYVLARSGGIASIAASVALNAGKDPYDALRLLEIGRGFITGLLLDMRSDISDLEIQHPDLAARVTTLRGELDTPINGMIPLLPDDIAYPKEAVLKTRREAHEALNRLIEDIRLQPGFGDFLLPPTADDMMTAADPDPIIVVNLSPLRNDAFLVERHQISVLRLSNFDLHWVQEYSQEIEKAPRIILEWLWDALAGPCLETLGFQTPVTDDNWPHVWWITAGSELSTLPIHAAGRHVLGSQGIRPSDTVLDRVMSSYNSSIKTIIHGRRHRKQDSSGQSLKDALLISMENTPNQSALPFAQDEVAVLEQLCPSLTCKPSKPYPDREQVLKQLKTAEIFQFAGHGKSDALDPSLSTLFLKDWESNPLTVRDLRDLKLQKNPPFPAYLSACSTGTNSIPRLQDEGIHLVNACQLAGFRHVIGTFAEVPDEHCSAMAETFYKTIRDEGMTDRAVYRGVHRAVRALRDKQVALQSDTEARKQTNADSCDKERPRDGTVVDEDDDLGIMDQGIMAEYDRANSWISHVHFGV